MTGEHGRGVATTAGRSTCDEASCEVNEWRIAVCEQQWGWRTNHKKSSIDCMYLCWHQLSFQRGEHKKEAHWCGRCELSIVRVNSICWKTTSARPVICSSHQRSPRNQKATDSHERDVARSERSLERRRAARDRQVSLAKGCRRGGRGSSSACWPRGSFAVMRTAKTDQFCARPGRGMRRKRTHPCLLVELCLEVVIELAALVGDNAREDVVAGLFGLLVGKAEPCSGGSNVLRANGVKSGTRDDCEASHLNMPERESADGVGGVDEGMNELLAASERERESAWIGGGGTLRTICSKE